MAHQTNTLLTAENKSPTLQTIFKMLGILFVIHQFRNYSLRTKLIIAFLGVSALSIGGVAYFSNRATNTALVEQAGANLHSMASSVALAMGGSLNEQITLLQSLASDQSLRLQLQVANGTYKGSLADIQAGLRGWDQKWDSRPDTDSVVGEILFNQHARRFKDFSRNFPDHFDLLVTDKYGALAAASIRPADYYLADKAWWQAAYNNGQGAVYIGQPEFDPGTATPIINMAVPIYALDGNIQGVLYSKYRLTSLANLLAAVQIGQTGRADLLFPDSQVLLNSRQNLLPLDSEILTQLQAIKAQDYAQFTYKLEPSLVSQARLRPSTGEPAIENLDWTLVVHQTSQEALAMIEAQRRNAVLLGLSSLILAAIVAVAISQQLARPIVRLTQTAQQVSAGNLEAQVPVESTDEVGQLAVAFNRMTQNLHETIGSLEDKVAARTWQLEAVVEVSQHLTGILDLDTLLHQVVTLTKETFNYYHVHIYLLEGNQLIVAEGYGPAGAEMKRQRYAIPLDAPQSLVARAARESKIITAENVRLDPNWQPSPLLPDTQAEMAVPVMFNLEILGVLDVQSNKIGGLTKEDEAILQILANQVATVVRNARLFTQTQNALAEAQNLQLLYTDQAWEYLQRTHRADYEFNQLPSASIKESPTPEVATVLQQKQTVQLKLTRAGNGDTGDSTGPSRAALATPLKLRDQVIGVLGLHTHDPNRQWQADEIALIETISEQMSLALENARLFEESQRSAWRDQVVSETTAKVWSSAEIEGVMREAVAQLGDKLKASEVVIRLGTENIFDS